MSAPHIVSRAEFETAREALLAEEKAVTRARDAVAAKRRAMPMEWRRLPDHYEN